MMLRPLTRSAGLLLGGLVLAGSLPADAAAVQTEGTAAEQPSLFLDTVDVEVVNVEVFVTGRDGDRVTGLIREDFELYETGPYSRSAPGNPTLAVGVWGRAVGGGELRQAGGGGAAGAGGSAGGRVLRGFACD